MPKAVRLEVWLSSVLLAGIVGCASASSMARGAPRIAFAALPAHPEQVALIAKQPVVLVFEAGERVPVWFDLQSSLLATSERPEKFEVTTSQRFYLLVNAQKGVFRISTDGQDFDQGPRTASALDSRSRPGEPRGHRPRIATES